MSDKLKRFDRNTRNNESMSQKDNAQSKLAGNALSGIAATIIYMVSRLLLTPFILRFLSLSEFGLWSLCFIILSYAGMGGFGVNSTYIRYSARYLAEKKETEISRLLSTGVAYMFSFSLLFCTILYLMMPFVLERFHVEPATRELASTLLLGTAAVFSLELTLGGFRFILNGIHEYSKERAITTVAGLIEIAVIITFLWLGAGVKGLLYAFALRLVLETMGCWNVARRKIPSLSISLRLVSREHFRLFFSFGLKVQVLGIIAIFLSAVDRMFITAISGLAAGGMFELGRKLPSTAGSVSSSAFGPLLSVAAHVEENWSGQRMLTLRERSVNYLYISLATASLGLVPAVFVSSFQHYLPVTSPVAATLSGCFSLGILFMFNRSVSTESPLAGDDLRKLYLSGIRFTNIINSILFMFLISMAHPLINTWVGSAYAEAAEIMMLLSIAYSVQLCTGPVTLIFRGIDRNGRELEYLLVQTILMLIWIPSGTMLWGLKGAAAGIACSSMVSTLFLLWRSNMTFAIPFREFTSLTILPGLVPVLPAIAIFSFAKLWPQSQRLGGVVQIFLCGTLYVLVCGTLFWKFILDDSEKTKASELMPFKKRSA